jgi:hypothetical protein
MKKNTVVIIVGFILVCLFWAGTVIYKMNVIRGEVELSSRFDAQHNVVETSLFRMRTTIKNMHQCTTEWADKFIEVVAMQARGRQGNQMNLPQGSENGGIIAANAGMSMQIGRESEALGIPSDLYMRLSNAIEGQIASFVRQQDILTDIWREHAAYCKNPYNNILGLNMQSKVMDRPKMITSQDTKNAIESGIMDEKLF